MYGWTGARKDGSLGVRMGSPAFLAVFFSRSGFPPLFSLNCIFYSLPDFKCIFYSFLPFMLLLFFLEQFFPTLKSTAGGLPLWGEFLGYSLKCDGETVYSAVISFSSFFFLLVVVPSLTEVFLFGPHASFLYL